MVWKVKGRFHVVRFSIFPIAAFGLVQSLVRIKMRVALNNTSAHSAHARAHTRTHQIAGADKTNVTLKSVNNSDRLGDRPTHFNYMHTMTTNRSWIPPQSRADTDWGSQRGVAGGEYIDPAEVMYRDMDWSSDPVTAGTLEFHR